MAVTVDIKQLLEAGVHFGHKTSRWHPKMAPYIHSKRQDSHIIDLTKTVEGLDKALPFLTSVAASGKQVLFVGTKKQAKDAVKATAEKVNQPQVWSRLGNSYLDKFMISEAIDCYMKAKDTTQFLRVISITENEADSGAATGT